MKKINFGPTVVFYILSFISSSIIEIRELFNMKVSDRLYLIDLVLWAILIVLFALLIYKCCKALPEELRTIHPALAIALFIIPGVDLPGRFIVCKKLSQGYYRRGQIIINSEFKDLSGLGYIYASLRVTSVILSNYILNPEPLIILVDFAAMCLFIIFFSRIVGYANYTILQNNALNEGMLDQEKSDQVGSKEWWIGCVITALYCIYIIIRIYKII